MNVLTLYLKPILACSNINLNIDEIRNCVILLDKIIDTILSTKEREKYDALSSRSVSLIQSIVPLILKAPS
jgi:hypothetical protein